MKRICITGVSGFVARYFIEYLDKMEPGCSVLGLDVRKPESSFDHVHAVSLTNEIIDLLDYQNLRRSLARFKPDALLHLASYSSVAFSWKEPVQSFANNTNVFLNLIDSVRAEGIPCRILSVGSSEEYGMVALEDLPLRETHPIDPQSPYAVARCSQEMLSKVFTKGYGMDILMTRSFNHYGARQKDTFVIPSFVKQLVMLKRDRALPRVIRTGNIDIIRDILDVRDVVNAYHTLLERGRSGEIYNVCSGIGRSLRSVLELLQKIIGISVDIQIDPGLLRMQELPRIVGDRTKIEHEIGWKPLITLEDGLTNLVGNWVR